jgi:hypothetical protein
MEMGIIALEYWSDSSAFNCSELREVRDLQFATSDLLLPLREHGRRLLGTTLLAITHHQHCLPGLLLLLSKKSFHCQKKTPSNILDLRIVATGN